MTNLPGKTSTVNVNITFPYFYFTKTLAITKNVFIFVSICRTIEIMLSKLSFNLLNTTLRFNTSLPVLRNTKFTINWQTIHFRGSTRNFHSNKYDLQKLSSKPKGKPDKKSAENVSAQSVGLYSMAIAVLCGGLTFAAVPLYRLFCQVYIVCMCARSMGMYVDFFLNALLLV